MPRQPWLADVVADAFRGVRGFRVDTYPGWQSRGTTSFDPIGVMDHHTGPGAYNNLLNYMAAGPVHPPLCNIATSRPSNGVVRITIVAAGRANHAGTGQLNWTGTNGGNFRTIGIENQNDGSQSWPSQQLEAIARLDAALLRRMNVGLTRLTFHKTYAPGRKPDPHSLNLSSHRARAQAYIAGNPKEEEVTEEQMNRLLAAIGAAGANREGRDLQSANVWGHRDSHDDNNSEQTKSRHTLVHARWLRSTGVPHILDGLDELATALEGVAGGDTTKVGECSANIKEIAAEVRREFAESLKDEDDK